jgi:hypothetical protein
MLPLQVLIVGYPIPFIRPIGIIPSFDGYWAGAMEDAPAVPGDLFEIRYDAFVAAQFQFTVQ